MSPILLRRACALLLFLLAVPAVADEFEADHAARFTALALDCVHREYPNKIAHVMHSDADALPPRELSPAFYGCFDWHSSVHGHWLLARSLRRFPAAENAAEVRAALNRSLTDGHIAGERAYIDDPGRIPFERPYGLAWLLQLCAELRGWDDPDAVRWSAALEPLEALAAARFADWLPKLTYPIRTGEHSQTAFALGLALDWARLAAPDVEGAAELAALIEAKAREFHLGDTGCNLAYEPSGQDFLSPCLAEADLMRRVLAPGDFAQWLTEFLPEIPAAPGVEWLPVAHVSDRTDGKLAHLDGLNLSRAWMLEGIAAGLPGGDPRVREIVRAASFHRHAGLQAVTGEHYEGGHWLGSFAMYLVTKRGLPK
jgi:hypothetical protein